jgi:hypothetical protein
MKASVLAAGAVVGDVGIWVNVSGRTDSDSNAIALLEETIKQPPSLVGWLATRLRQRTMRSKYRHLLSSCLVGLAAGCSKQEAPAPN